MDALVAARHTHGRDHGMAAAPVLPTLLAEARTRVRGSGTQGQGQQQAESGQAPEPQQQPGQVAAARTRRRADGLVAAGQASRLRVLCRTAAQVRHPD